MDILKGFGMSEGEIKDYVLKTHRNIYGQKQAGRVWNQYLVGKLVRELKFIHPKQNVLVFYQGTNMYALYKYGLIFAGPQRYEIYQIIKEMQEANLDITIRGDLQEFLGVKIEKKANGMIHLTQPNLINKILKDLRSEGEM